MAGKIYLFAILTILATCAAKKIKIVPPNSHVYNLALKFNEDKMNDYVIDSFFATNSPNGSRLLHCEVTLNDIMKAIPIKKLATKDFIAAFNKLNISVTNDDLNDFISSINYEDLVSMGFSAEKAFKNFMKTYFKDRPVQLQQCLNVLGVSTDFAMAYTFGSDEDLFVVLRSANVSYDNLAEIANIIDSSTTLKDLVNILGVKKLNETLLSNFINTKISSLLFDRGLTQDRFKQFLQSLGLSISNYKNSKSFKNCYSSLTKEKSLAVAVSRNEIITNDDSLIAKYINLEPYTTLSAETLEDGGSTYTISADNINANSSDNIIRIKVVGILPGYVQQTNTYQDMPNQVCYYITVDSDGELLVQGTAAELVNDQLTITKSYNNIFKKGSPLICGQNLYGLAAINRINAIVFDDFGNTQNEEASQILEDPKIIAAIKEFFGKIIENFDPCNYLSCANIENNDETTNKEVGIVENQDSNSNEQEAKTEEDKQNTDTLREENQENVSQYPVDKNQDQTINLEEQESASEHDRQTDAEGGDQTQTKLETVNKENVENQENVTANLTEEVKEGEEIAEENKQDNDEKQDIQGVEHREDNQDEKKNKEDEDNKQDQETSTLESNIVELNTNSGEMVSENIISVNTNNGDDINIETKTSDIANNEEEEAVTNGSTSI